MINVSVSLCPVCGGKLKYYDSVKRIAKTKYGVSKYTTIRRLRCVQCNKIHRQLTADIFPYKHYESEMIVGVLHGFITPDTYGFEDYPSEITMKRWKKEYADISTDFDLTNSDFYSKIESR